MTHSFWISITDDAHAKAICEEHGLEFRMTRRVPQLSKPVSRRGIGPAKGRQTFAAVDLFHLRAHKECTAEEAQSIAVKVGNTHVEQIA